MALTHSTRYSTSQRCPPHYFGRDFARGQRIGNPAALAACCRSFSDWWPLYHSLKALETANHGAGNIFPMRGHISDMICTTTRPREALAAATVGNFGKVIPLTQSLPLTAAAG